MAFKLPTLSLKSMSCKSNDDLESFDFGKVIEKQRRHKLLEGNNLWDARRTRVKGGESPKKER